MKTRLLALSTLTVALSLCAACGGQGNGNSAAPAAANETATDTVSETAGAETSPATESPSPGTSPGASPSASPFGAGCASFPASGRGSLTQLASEPVATALGSVPSLSTLASAVKKAGLVETLDSAQDITIFAPTNEAFDKLPKKKLNQTLSDRKALTTLLSYHVAKGRKTPTDLQSGKITTLQGTDLTVTGSGQNYKINDADVLCGDVPTRNATVYVIDKVLLPK
ncbi:fasciclin domain-containing protein [Microbispora sp. ATCC PTA-5024]|uniref:fasciclin domain-containing protein n=1 Tax=Microbispora sp. ATCC PTA-5024 TaxID=316330 RepID=UPI0003DCD72A|nr:fasciclin domain-containing protein [Microbispora sp. ATCC PTA-5024]ETK30496.1 hypothetical protein MPTA5024_39960 [Microbispora sp. ATCC PTA-5024]